MLKRLIGATCAVALIGGAALADSAGEAWAPETFSLENGMEVVVLPDHRAPVVTHMVWYRVGAVDELPGKSGIAHLFEHVMFQETDDLAPGELDEIVQRNGGQLNAFTSWDYTAYYERVAKDRLELMMTIEADRMRDLVVNDDPEGPFISERDVVKEERRQRIENNPGAILFEQVMGELYPDHPYGIPVIGHMDEVAALTPEDGLHFYNTWYSPDQAILVVAGDVTAEDVRPMAERTYGVLAPTGTDTRPERGWGEVAELAESKTLTHTDPKVRQPEWDRYYLSTSFIQDDELAYALQVGLDVMGGGQTSLLYQSLVEDQQVAVSASSWGWMTLHDRAPAGFSAIPAPDVLLDDLEAAFMAEVEAILAEGLSEEDVERSRNSLAAASIYGRDSQSGMANLYGRSLATGASIQDVLDYPERVKAVTAEDATAALRAVFGPDKNYINGRLLPAEETFQ
ncbi:MAG: insulinase family protein [Hyphomonadaceae bacterium]|nr:insulinase family protein [Hyphomonadaceae bacterium]